MTEDTKQIIVVRRDLKMRRGKECAQSGHAAIGFIEKRLDLNETKQSIKLTDAEISWFLNGTKKVTCQVDSLRELLDIAKKAKDAGVQCNIITDSGHTEFHMEPTITCLAIGPDFDSKIDVITGNLKLY
jgi:PTH2 family peptidyl-tRNA hydrolase